MRQSHFTQSNQQQSIDLPVMTMSGHKYVRASDRLAPGTIVGERHQSRSCTFFLNSALKIMGSFPIPFLTPRSGLQYLPGTVPLTPLAAFAPPLLYYLPFSSFLPSARLRLNQLPPSFPSHAPFSHSFPAPSFSPSPSPTTSPPPSAQPTNSP